jgi:hypothetical protein
MNHSFNSRKSKRSNGTTSSLSTSLEKPKFGSGGKWIHDKLSFGGKKEEEESKGRSELSDFNENRVKLSNLHFEFSPQDL